MDIWYDVGSGGAGTDTLLECNEWCYNFGRMMPPSACLVGHEGENVESGGAVAAVIVVLEFNAKSGGTSFFLDSQNWRGKPFSAGSPFGGKSIIGIP